MTDRWGKDEVVAPNVEQSAQRGRRQRRMNERGRGKDLHFREVARHAFSQCRLAVRAFDVELEVEFCDDGRVGSKLSRAPFR